MEAYLSTKELWEYVDGSSPKPSPADPSNVTAGEAKELADWKRKTAKASGELWLAIEDSQKVHIKEIKGDPVTMWKKLEGVHLQKKPGTRFNAYEVLFSIRKAEEESLTTLMARADKAMQNVKALRPTTFTLDDLDKELVCMALIRSLPADYNNFASSLLLLDSLDLTKLQSAFQNEEMQRTARHIDTSPALALHTSQQHGSCYFCGGTSHFEKDCEKKKRASEEAKKNTAQWKAKRGGRGKGKQNAKEATTQEKENGDMKIESAGSASALSSADDHAKWSRSQAASDWNADTGTSSHMTPHCHWFRSYTPHIVPI